MLDRARTIYNFVLDLVFPICCAQCGLEGEYLCELCAKTLLETGDHNQICPGCGRHSRHGQTHAECRPVTYLDGLTYAFSYNQPAIKKLISWLKYQNISDASKPCGKSLALRLKKSLPIIISLTSNSKIVLAPIPLHPKRFQWRSYNQAELITNHIATTLNIPTQNNLLTKTKHTNPQAKLNKVSRVTNATNSFQLIQAPDPDAVFILVDDVATTRATLNAAAQQLKTAQAKFVWAATVAFEP